MKSPGVLTHESVVPYLLSQGKLTERDVVDGSISVVDVSRRNRNYWITLGENSGFLTKQGVSQDPTRADFHTVRYEADVYELLARVKGGRLLAPFLPSSLGFDSEERVFVLELLPRATSLLEYYFQHGRFPLAHGRLMGKALAALHRINVEEIRNCDIKLAASPAPGIFRFHKPNLESLQSYSATSIQLLQMIQQFPSFVKNLDELATDWTENGIIHSDIKWENWCLCSSGRTVRRTNLKLLDWETTGFGDICWDIGSVFGSYLGFWISTMPVTKDIPTELLPGLTRYPLTDMQPPIKAFWSSYLKQMGWSNQEARDWLEKSVRFSAARLLQTAFEQLQSSSRITGAAICLVQTSCNILNSPEKATQELLGLTLD